MAEPVSQPTDDPVTVVTASTDKVCVGVIMAAHGVRGLVKLKSFTADPGTIGRYGPLRDETGTRWFRIALVSSGRDQGIARVEGVTDRDQAAALKGVRLYVDRAALPEPQADEFYHADLLGLPVVDGTGQRRGRVVALHDFGAGDVVEIALDAGGTAMLPFTRAAVPVVDVRGGRIVIDPPADWLDPPETAPDGAEEGP